MQSDALPKWLLHWRCPHCGTGAKYYQYTSDYPGPGHSVFTCYLGHRRRVEGHYADRVE